MGTTVTASGAYTEATHTAWGTVSEAAPIAVSDRKFRPERITVNYDWRTQLDHDDWGGVRIEVAGPWLDEDGEPTGSGSGSVLLGLNDAPTWAQEFVRANVPTVGLRPLTKTTVTVEGHTYVPWTDSRAVGYEVTHADGRKRYIYLNPSGGDDEGVACVFIYVGAGGDLDADVPACYLDVFDDEPKPSSR